MAGSPHPHPHHHHPPHPHPHPPHPPPPAAHPPFPAAADTATEPAGRQQRQQQNDNDGLGGIAPPRPSVCFFFLFNCYESIANTVPDVNGYHHYHHPSPVACRPSLTNTNTDGGSGHCNNP